MIWLSVLMYLLCSVIISFVSLIFSLTGMVKGGYMWLIKGVKVRNFLNFCYKWLTKAIKKNTSERFKSLCPCQKKTLIVIQSESFSTKFALWASEVACGSEVTL